MWKGCTWTGPLATVDQGLFLFQIVRLLGIRSTRPEAEKLIKDGGVKLWDCDWKDWEIPKNPRIIISTRCFLLVHARMNHKKTTWMLTPKSDDPEWNNDPPFDRDPLAMIRSALRTLSYIKKLFGWVKESKRNMSGNTYLICKSTRSQLIEAL